MRISKGDLVVGTAVNVRVKGNKASCETMILYKDKLAQAPADGDYYADTLGKIEFSSGDMDTGNNNFVLIKNSYWRVPAKQDTGEGFPVIIPMNETLPDGSSIMRL